MSYKVVVWGTGRVGKSALISVINRPELELVGVYVYSEEKAGKDAGEICGQPETGIRATNNPADIYSLEADIVVMTNLPNPADITEMDEYALEILASGKNIVTTAAYRYLPYPGRNGDRTPESVQKFLDACAQGQSTLYGTGENPGFYFERLATTLTALSQDIDCITMEEYSDCSHWVVPDDPIKNLMQFGTPIDEFEASPIIQAWYDREFGEAVSCVAEVLGIEFDRFEWNLEAAPAYEDIEIHHGTIKKGGVSAMRYEQFAYKGDKPVLKYRAYWTLSKDVPEFESEKWTYWQNDDVWRILIEGRPAFEAVINLGLTLDGSIEGEAYSDGQQPMFMITAAAAVNSIPHVCAAEPGLMKPVVQGHYSPELKAPGYEPPALKVDV
jgi:hypothetical protein